MANRARGETGMEIGGKTYNLSLNLGALAAVEDAFGGMPFEDVVQSVLGTEKISHRKFLDFLNAVMAGNGCHEDGVMETLDTGRMTALAAELVARAFPEPDPKRKRKGAQENP